MSEQEKINNHQDEKLTNEDLKNELISGVAWSKIEKVPKNWQLNNIEKDIEILTGYNFSSENFDPENGVPLIRIRDLGTGETETNYKGKYEDKYLVDSGDLLIGMDGEFNPYLWDGNKALLNQRICKIIPKSNYNQIFLRYALKKPLFYIQKSISGTTVKHLSQYNINSINLPTPPLPEQRKIATVLYNVDQAIQKIEEIIEQTQRVKKGLMQDLLSEGTDDHELKETDTVYGKLPESWEISRIGEIFEVIGGSTPSTDEPEYWNGDIPWATPTDITELESLTIDETERKITEEGLESTSVHLLPPYSLLLTSRATIGACAVNTVEMATNQGFQNLVPVEEDKIDIWYTYYRIIDLAEYLESLGAGSTFSEISNSMVKKIQFPVPPIKEQKELGRILKDIDKSKLEYINQKEELQRLKKGLMQDLLTGKVRTKDKDIEVLDEVKEYDT